MDRIPDPRWHWLLKSECHTGSSSRGEIWPASTAEHTIVESGELLPRSIACACDRGRRVAKCGKFVGEAADDVVDAAATPRGGARRHVFDRLRRSALLCLGDPLLLKQPQSLHRFSLRGFHLGAGFIDRATYDRNDRGFVGYIDDVEQSLPQTLLDLIPLLLRQHIDRARHDLFGLPRTALFALNRKQFFELVLRSEAVQLGVDALRLSSLTCRSQKQLADST